MHRALRHDALTCLPPAYCTLLQTSECPLGPPGMRPLQDAYFECNGKIDCAAWPLAANDLSVSV